MVYGYDIEEGVELPPEMPRKTGAPPKYPFKELKVGQGFFVPNTTRRSMYPTVRKWEKRLGITCDWRNMKREIDGANVNGVFVKRVR